MDLPDWDRHWSEVISSNFWRLRWMEATQLERTSLRYLRWVEDRRGHRVLLAGNGISTEPHALAHMGCDVTVVDVSGVACRFLSAMEPNPGLLAPMFPAHDEARLWGWVPRRLSPEKSRARAAAEGRPGGRLSVVNADLFEYEPDQPFHLIASRRSYRGFPPVHRQELARRFHHWLHPGGLAFVQMHNTHHERDEIRGPLPRGRIPGCAGLHTLTRRPRRVLFWYSSG
jgi:hypothetical protein